MACSQLKMQLERQSGQSAVARRTGKITLQSLILLGGLVSLTQRGWTGLDALTGT